MPSRLRRGFRKEAEEYAAEFRTELGRESTASLSGMELAKHLYIPVTKLTELPNVSRDVIELLSGPIASPVSATTLCDGPYRHIIFNDVVHSNRVNSSIMHEIAHVLLGHPPMPPLTALGHRNVDRVLEDEADQLAFTLLVPKPAALFAYENFESAELAAIHYGVSQSLLTLRYRLCDVARWSQDRTWKLQQSVSV